MRIGNRSAKVLIALCVAAVLAGSACGQEQERRHRIGGGAHYWKTIDDIKEEGKFDSDGLAWLVSYQYAFSLLKLELGAEIFPNGYYGSEELTVAPEAFIGLSTIIYAGVGIGTACASDLDKTFSDPFYIARAGLDLELLPALRLDINGNYYFTSWDTLEDVNTDTITFGAQLRFAF